MALYTAALFMAMALIAFSRWSRERRALRWREVVNTRLSGAVPAMIEELDDDLSASYHERVIRPKIEALRAAVARRIGPAAAHRELEQKLRMAGIRQAPEMFLLTRIASSLAALGLTVAGALSMSTLPPDEKILGPVLVAGMVFIYPSIHMNTKVKLRLQEVDRSLPEVFDLLSVSVEAGLAFDGALRRVVANIEGPIKEELARVLADMQLGIPRAEALTSLARRTQSVPLKRFAGLVSQSDRTGSSISAALKVQAKDIKEYRAAKAREKAASIPIKIIFPMVLFIFPAMFIVILGPAVISVLQLFHV